ncbi:hypothetical protein LOAG_13410 [Loa loa]|uniref:Uncharacterized protein n=1 Tax=Loa loa TaxID=7209 RepID=A0A1S0TJI3_LOALO|nr:hypothetical protein LOAG_13410 [Loa loa]EFO15104.1 hypothetical protein LOAG_13410 [Loa loa]
MKEGCVPASTLFTIYFNMMLLQRAMTNLDEGNGIYIRYRTMKAMRLRSLKKSAPQNDHLHPLIIIDESEPKLIQTVQLFGEVPGLVPIKLSYYLFCYMTLNHMPPTVTVYDSSNAFTSTVFDMHYGELVTGFRKRKKNPKEETQGLLKQYLSFDHIDYHQWFNLASNWKVWRQIIHKAAASFKDMRKLSTMLFASKFVYTALAFLAISKPTINLDTGLSFFFPLRSLAMTIILHLTMFT